MRAALKIRLLLLLVGFAVSLPEGRAQNALTVENVLTDKFPELGFDVRATENLVANKAKLTIKDNYVPVAAFKIAAGKKTATGTLYTIRYTVPDPQRLDGTTTFGYNGEEITTTYLVKKPTEAQKQAYPKEEHTDNTIFYIIGGLGLLAGVAGLLLSRRKRKQLEGAAEFPQIPQPVPPVPSVSGNKAPVIAMPVSSGIQIPVSGDEAYKPRPLPPKTADNRVTETQVSPQILPSLALLVDGQPQTYTLTGAAQTIGRSPECAIVVLHPTVSKVHAQVQLRDSAWWIEDLGSTNGTYVDGKKITKTLLHHGSRLHFGQVSGTFTLSNA